MGDLEMLTQRSDWYLMLAAQADDFFSRYGIACIYDFFFRNGICAIVYSPHQGQMGNTLYFTPAIISTSTVSDKI